MIHLVQLFVEIDEPFFHSLMGKIERTGLFAFFLKPHLLALLFAAMYAIGTKGMKSPDITLFRSLVLIIIGTGLYFGACLTLMFPTAFKAEIYIITLALGYLLLLAGMLHLRRIIYNNLMKDQFNKKNKLFRQEKKLISNPYSVNIKTQDGYINIVNPFRATMVLGTPGSGKSYAVVEEFIRQHIQKGFGMLVYDFKYPDLSQVAYNYFLKYHANYKVKPRIYIINFNDCKNSHRVNPISPKLIMTQADALATAEALFLNINKEYIRRKDFFTASGVNLVASCWVFLKKHCSKY